MIQNNLINTEFNFTFNEGELKKLELLSKLHYDIALIIYNSDDKITADKIAMQVGITRRTVQEITARLIKEGFRISANRKKPYGFWKATSKEIEVYRQKCINRGIIEFEKAGYAVRNVNQNYSLELQ